MVQHLSTGYLEPCLSQGNELKKYTWKQSKKLEGEFMKKPKLLWISDDPNIHSGNAKVTKNVLMHLQKDFEITSVIGWNGLGQRHNFPYHIWPVDFLKRDHEEMMYLVAMVINEEKPDVLMVHGDIWDFWWLPKLKMPHVKKVGYITVDVHPLRPEWNEIWNSFDSLAIPSKWGAQLVKDVSNLSPSVVYEGVDTDIFKPLSDKERQDQRQNIRQSCVKGGLWDPKFMITMLARAMPRKNLPAGIRAIANLGKKYQDIGHIILYPIDETEPGSHNMDEYNRRYLNSKMAKIKGNSVGPRSSMSDHDIAKTLGYSDILLFPSMHEGFGLPVLEAMACGCVPVAANCSTMPELLGNEERGLLANIGGIFVEASGKFSGMEEEVVSDESLLGKLESLHNNPSKLEELRTSGIAWAKEKTWAKTAESLKEIAFKTLARNEKDIYMKEL